MHNDRGEQGGGPPPQLVRHEVPGELPAGGAGGDRRRSRGDSGEMRHGAAAALPECAKENLIPLSDHEVELLIPNADGYQVGQTVRSESKTVGNFRFRILVFPSGTQTTGGNQVSAFVEADPFPDLDNRWAFHSVKYQVCVINWLDYRKSVNKMDTWTFCKEGIDRGWHDMVRTSDLSSEAGWLGPDNALYVRAQCYVRMSDSILVGSDYNTKKETGCVGLKNHGATCYMNGLLQSLFHVGEFRRIVYSIDCDDNPDAPGKDDVAADLPIVKSVGCVIKEPIDASDGEGKAPPLIQALQNVFYRMHTADQAVDCRELMKSFGWDTTDAFTQHDAQELNRILCDRLEEQMKGTSMDGSIKKLFEGEMENYIECMDVDYKSKRNETFYDVQLNIKSERGHELRNIEESLREFTSEETLEGENAYEAEGHGKQRAKKGIRFLRFPPVLNLQLKRFHFDLEKMDMVKLNTKFEFHKRLDLSEFAPDAGVYSLYAVLVHSGDVNSGHYYAFIRSDTEGQGWLKFDDDTVTPCSEYAAVDDNYAGADTNIWNYIERTPKELRGAQAPVRSRIHNAYILVYIREDVARQIIMPPDPRATNPKMVDRCDREVRVVAQREREKVEQRSKIKVKLVFERDLCKMGGFWDHAEIPHSESYKMGREQLVRDLVVEIEKQINVPKSYIALFSLQYRNNPRQVRFSHLPCSQHFKQHIPQFSAPHFDTSDPSLVILCVLARDYNIYTMKPSSPDAQPDQLLLWNDDTAILLVVKYFCVVSRKIVTLGCYYMQQAQPLSHMVSDGWVTKQLQPFLGQKVVAALSEEVLATTHQASGWECWEEFSERDIQARNPSKTVKNEHLWTGDVVVWQLASQAGGGAGPTGAIADGDAPSSPTNERPQEAGEAELDGDVGPQYPVHTVSDLAAHIANAAEVSLTLHDVRQPLCVDGMVSNGHWGPPRPASAASPSPTGAAKKADGAGAPASPNTTVGPQKEEKPEDQALALCPAKFNPAQDRELKMDLRWQLNHVTGAISRAFALRGQACDAGGGSQGGVPGAAAAQRQIWLFHAAPASSCEEPLNTQAHRTEQTTLKDLQRTAGYLTSTTTNTATKKPAPLALHAVELPFQLNSDVLDRGLAPLCIRFFDAAVREVGSALITVPSSGTVQDIINEAKTHMQPQWNIAAPLRVLEVSEGRLHRQHAWDTPVRQLSCFTRLNIFYHCLRVEADTDVNLPEGNTLMEIYHCDRQSQHPFGQPLLVPLAPGEKSVSIKTRCKAKLQVPDNEFKSWRLVRYARNVRVHLKDDDPWDGDLVSDIKLYLEHVHPNPTSGLLARQSRYNKPLTIKG